MIFTPQLSKLFEDVGHIIEEQATAWPFSASSIAINMWSKDDALVVQAALPGVDAASIEVEVLKDHLQIKARRKNAVPAGAESHVEEASATQLERRLRLPFAVDADSAQAAYKDGVLTLQVQQVATDKPSKVPVDIK